jgi:hypothetical protein
MTNATRILILAVSATLALPAFGDDQQKAEKELTKITAMATDFTGRRAVNLTMSETFGVPRPKLVETRTQTGLNYGSLFVAEQLVKNGLTVQDIAAQLQSGKNIGAIANEQHLDWKEMARAAKKFNSAVDTNLYKYFIHEKGSVAQDVADKYDVHYDGVKADADVSKEDISAAQDRFSKWKDQAAKAQGSDRDKTLSTGDERVAYSDHTASGPVSSGTAGRGGGSVSGGEGNSAPVSLGGPH